MDLLQKALWPLTVFGRVNLLILRQKMKMTMTSYLLNLLMVLKTSTTWVYSSVLTIVPHLLREPVGKAYFYSGQKDCSIQLTLMNSKLVQFHPNLPILPCLKTSDWNIGWSLGHNYTLVPNPPRKLVVNWRPFHTKIFKTLKTYRASVYPLLLICLIWK